MIIHTKALVKIMGMLSVISGFSMIFPLIVGAVYKEESSVTAFAHTIVASLVFGLLLILLSRRMKGNKRFTHLKTRDAFLIVALTWILFSAIAAFPYIIQGCIPRYIDAFFEASSGFTTTGSSILTDVEVLPKSMMFWRMFAHWLGGMGILVLAIALLPQLGINGQAIVNAETPGPTLSKVTPKMSDTARTLYLTYFAFTIAETILLMMGGLNFFDSITHTFATVGTGGFSGYNDSVAHFQSAYVDGVFTLFMILSGINFNLYFLTFKGGISKLLKDSELQAYLIFIGGATLLLTLYLYLGDFYETLGKAFRYSIFQAASIITTTGFATADFNLWPAFCVMILLFLYFAGGCSSSTGGGIKIVRILIILKMIKRAALLRLHPNALIPIRLDDRPLPGDTIQSISSFVFFYITILFSVGILVSLDGYDMVTSFSAAATCLGNIGPGFHDIGPTMNFSGFSDPVKLLLSFTMIAGRLELFTLLMLLSRKFWNPTH